jgi:fumarate hydratase subunit alpha
MRIINSEIIINKVVETLSEIGYSPDISLKNHISNSISNEKNPRAKDVLNQLIDNINIAKEKNFPLCQDTGIVVFFIKIGYQIQISDMSLTQALNKAVAKAYTLNNYRYSVVSDPIERVNTKDNTPAIIHTEVCDEDILHISMMLKGGGSENMSALKMLKPSDGIIGIRNFVIDTVKIGGANACPPLFVGVGIGGNFETCALLAKKSLLRTETETNPNPFWQKEEEILLNEINKLKIGPLGLGGESTAFKVCIETKPCHIASLPIAVNLECHSHRFAKLSF